MLLEECILISLLLKCGLIRQKVVSGDMTTIVLNYKWKSFIIEYELFNVETSKSKVDVLVQNKLVRRGVYFIRISNKNYPSYLKAPQYYRCGILPPVINTFHISRMFLQSITTDILDSICWNEYIISNSLKRSEL